MNNSECLKKKGLEIALSNCQIMVVDDTPESLKLLADLLLDEGYRVRPTNSPTLALESALDNPPDLILLDVKMPGMDGFEVCKRLKQDERTAKVPIIFVSALQEMHDRVYGFAVGGVDYITKPIQREEVLARVSTHLNLHIMQQHLSDMVEEKTYQLQLDEQRFSGLYELSQMRDSPEDQLASFALETAITITGSKVGYLHFVNEDQEHINLYQWSRETLKQCTTETNMHYPLSEAGIWADCVRLKRPVIHNDYPSQNNKHGLPEGHFPVQRHMSIPIMEKGKIVAIIGVGNKQHSYNEDDSRQLSLFGGSLWSIIIARRKDEELHTSLVQTIQAIAATVEQRDPYIAGHQRRVANLACDIAQEMGLDTDIVEGVRMGGIIHDIGKIYIPTEILNRPGKLTEQEYSIIKTHPDVGLQIIKDVKFPWPVATIIHQHHERLDGSGYPSGLSGDQIIIEARILAVADVVEAMASHRPYRPARGINAALEEIIRGRGKQYDPDVVDTCMHMFRAMNYSFGEQDIANS
ncbi:MAG: HD domain-containing phosphohydrolase [Candidatus Thiodiazotropha sp.]